MGGKKIVKRIKESLSLGSRSPSPQPDPSSSIEGPTALASLGNPSLAKFLEKELKEDYHKLVATSFAGFIKGDTGERNINFDEHLHFLGYKQKVKAVELLLKRFPDTKPVVFSHPGKNKTGRNKNTFMISFDQYEELLLAAQTAEGNLARKAVLAIKNAVFKYIKIEQQEQLEQQMSRLALKDKELEVFSAQKEHLEVALVAERVRRAALSALRTAEDAPQQIAYLMQSGTHCTYVKIGKTAEDAEKRKKELQTGNPEEITVLFEKKCVDSRLIEKNLHHIFRWYKRRGEWYEIDKQQAIFATQLMSHLLDGLRKVEYESTDIVEQCQELFREQGLELNPDSLTLNDVEVCEPAVSVVEESNPYIKYIDAKLEVTCDDQHRLVQNELETACKEWMRTDFRQVPFVKKLLWKALTDRGAIHKGAVRIGSKTPQGFSGVRHK